MEHEEQPLTSEEIRQIPQELVDEGFVEWSGEYRNGQKVWRVTDKSRYGDLLVVDASPN